MHYEIKKISGIACLFAPMQEGNSITIDISIKAWSIYEKSEEAGISHFLEHMFFKGGKKRKTPQEVAIAMDKIGAYFNASTWKESTSYYVKCAPQFALNGLEMLADMLMDATFQPEELEREKGVIIQELKMYEDSPQQLLRKKRSTFFLWDNAYGKPIIWYEETIKTFNREMLFAYKKELYTKDNILITIAGNITDQPELEQQIAILFWSLPEKKTRQKPDFQRSLPEQHSDFFSKDTEQTRILITIPGFTLKDDKLLTIASLLCTMLGGNMSSRLFQNIREKAGLCYAIHFWHASYQNYGYFYISAGLDKSKFTQGVEMIHQEIDQFISKGFSDQELENAKNYKTWSLQMGIESSDEMADFLSTQFLLENRIETIPDLINQYQAVTREDIQTLFPYLSRDKRRSYHIE